MKNIYVFLFILCSVALKSQTVFWTETFGVGTTCGANQATPANGFASSNGTWLTTTPVGGINDAFANIWYISQTEAGLDTVSVCGKSCITTPTLVNRTLHIGNVPGSPNSVFCPTGDCGANYDPGIGSNKVRTSIRAESPVVNCTGKSGISVKFNYILRGHINDSAYFSYFNGSTWITGVALAPTLTCSPAAGDTDGIWTSTTINLPATADNNGAVKIGFIWVNNDDGAGGNPSIAVDNIEVLADAIGSGPSTLTITIVPPDTISPIPLYCTNIPYHFTGRANPGPILFYHWWSYTSTTSNVTFNPNPPNQNGVDVTFPLPGTYTLVMSAASSLNGIDSNQIIVNVSPTPTITVTPPNPSVCLNGTGTNLYATGALTYTWTSTTPVLPPTYLDANGDSVTVNPVPTPSNVVTYTVQGTNAAGCTSLPMPITVTITAAPVPVYTSLPDTICNGSHSILSVGNMPVTTTYTWSASFTGGLGTNSGSSAQVTPIYTGVVDTTFTYTSNVNIVGCPVYPPKILKVVVKATPVVKTVSDTSDNCNHLGAILSATSTPVDPTTTYSWTPNFHLSSTMGSSVTATPTVPTKYYVTSTLNGCTSLKESVLVLIGDTTNASISSEYGIICLGQTNQFIAYPQNNTLNNSYSYSWQPSLSVQSSSIDGDTVVVVPTPSVGLAGVIYTLTVNGTCVKHNTATYDITVNYCIAPTADFSLNTHAICRQHCITFKDSTQYISTKPLTYTVVFVGGAIGNVPTGTVVGGNTLLYSITDSIPFPPVHVCYSTNSINNHHPPDANHPSGYNSDYFPITETVTSGGLSNAGSIKYDSVIVKKGPQAVIASNNQTVNEGASVTLNGSGSQGSLSNGFGQIISYSWTESDSGAISCATCSITAVTPTTTTEYTLTVTDNYGCSDTAMTIVYVDVVCKDVFVATAFSPNGDGLNDVLHVKSNCGMTNMSFKIFDRWGEKVFESTSLEYGWDGTYKNKQMNSDVFMYTLDGFLSSGLEVKKKGNVTLMR